MNLIEMIINLLIAPLIGAIAALALATAVELWKGRGRRRLYGEWLSAVQPVYYPTLKWHVQPIRIRWTIFGIEVRTVKKPGKLQWVLSARLYDKNFLVGPWKSLRPGAISNGFIVLHLSPNGKYMCGHDHAASSTNQSASFGVMLFGRTKRDLQTAWHALASDTRQMLPLTKRVEFTEDETIDIGPGKTEPVA